MLDQRHQRGELVSRITLTCLEDRDHTLSEEQRIGGVTVHGAPAMSA